MRILSLLILNFLTVLQVRPQVQPHGPDFRISCGICHSSKGWHLDKEVYSFNHNSTAFALTGEHTGADCRQCHPTLIFKDAKTQCSDCHNDFHQATVGLECSRCHTTKSWLVENINDIHRMSRFPLEGAHRTAICSDCHKSESMVRFDVPGINCIDCHMQDYQSAKEPDHVRAGYPEDCSFCHKINDILWTETDFTHTAFPLQEGHSSAKCADCHTAGNYSGVARECYKCHQKDYTESQKPDHNASKLPTNCENCHTLASGWKPTLFDHSNFPLTFGHSKPICIECHAGGNYTSTNPDCFSCHQANFVNSKNPNHQAAGFSNVCMTCHNTNPGWQPTTYVHGKFPLEKAHSVPDCIDCHTGDNYTTLKSDCYSCHSTDYTTAANPNHTSAGFPKTCETCHTATPGWKPANFNHNSFPLTKGHSTPLCNECHIGGNYTSTPKECNSCHQQDYTATLNPKHTAAGFSQDCLTCHTTDPGWKPTTFAHNNFPLTLAHSTPSCIECHVGEKYSGTSAECYSCHQTDYAASSNPKHSAAGFSTACQTCHTANPGWKPTSFNHSSFPLTAGHATPNCTDCHKGDNYTSIPTDCYACHKQDFLATTNPNHVNAAFPQTCITCHSTNPGWKPTTFSHGIFPLTLGHATVSCNDCHKGGNYTSISPECYSCHKQNFDNTADPKHSAAGFTTVCQTCHTTNPGWHPATFNHNFFPLTQGHSGPTCIQCHIGENYTTTTADCYGCHQTDFNSAANPNHVAAGFPLVCQSCHSTNPGWKPTTYNHNSFPLTQGHATPQCADCHKGGNYTTLPSDCYSCHQSDYVATTDPGHVGAGFPHECLVCHTTNPGWKPATFNHSDFPIYSGTHNYGVWTSCSDCHTNSSNYGVFSCISCHSAANTNPHHRDVGGYSYTPTSCYDCHRDGKVHD